MAGRRDLNRVLQLSSRAYAPPDAALTTIADYPAATDAVIRLGVNRGSARATSIG